MTPPWSSRSASPLSGQLILSALLGSAASSRPSAKHSDAPVARGDEPGRHFVHRWTARALAALRPGATRHAHQRAAAFWRWRVATFPQNREDAIEQLLEARYHRHAAGPDDRRWQPTMRL